MKSLMWLLPTALLAACATQPPAKLSTGPFASVTPLAAQTQNFAGNKVRWGGTIASVTPRKNETCFQVVSHTLDSIARPEEEDKSDGRFMACSPGFYDPVIYATGREVTVTGTLQPSVPGKIGEYDYLFPYVAADEIFLWPKRQVELNYPDYYYPLWMM